MYLKKSRCAGVLALALFLSPVVRETVQKTARMLTENREKALQGQEIQNMPRFYIMSQAVSALKTSPVLGIGTGSLTAFSKGEGSPVAHPHNNFMYMGVSFGIPGFLACAWLFWTLFSISWKRRSTPLGYFTFSTCLVLFLGGMFDTQLLNTGTLMMLAITYGFLNRLSREIEETDI